MVAWSEGTEASWQELASEVAAELKQWRKQHPKATFQEIEGIVDEELAPVRARMLEDMASASAAKDSSEMEEEEWPQCPKCGHKLEARGQDTRRLITNYNQTVSLRRAYAQCPACGAGLFPPGRGTKAGAGQSDPQPGGEHR